MAKIKRYFSLLKIIVCLASLINSSEAKKSDSKIVSVPSNNENNYCFTPECILTASRVLRYLDTNFDPCHNFYKFACGKFPKTYSLSKDRGDVLNHFSLLDYKIHQEMKSILEADYKATEPKFAKLIKTFYQSCLDATYKKKINLNSILKLVNKLGGWPLLKGKSWKSKNFQWEAFGSQLENVAVLENYFIISSIYADTKNSSINVLQIEQPPDLSITPDYYKRIVMVAELFGADEAKVRSELNRIIGTQTLLFNISLPVQDRNDSSIRMTVNEMERNYSNILWKPYFNAFLKPFNEIHDDDVVLVRDNSYFKKFNLLIKQISKRDQANYLIFKAIDDFLDDYLKSIKKKYNKWESCYKTTETLFSNSFGALYYKNSGYDKFNFKRVDEILKSIFEEFDTILTKSDWLDKKTKEKAIEKLSSIYIVHPSVYKLYDDKEIDEFYKNLELSPGDYVQSVINITLFNQYYDELNSFRKPRSMTNWKEYPSPADVNAVYIVVNNTIAISPSILQDIFFHESRPQYMNYASVGFVIGHEITHAFDNVGRNYDKRGNIEDWWDPKTTEEFISKSKCIIDQYGNYKVEEVDLNIEGEFTKEENLADNVGLKVAYLAYENYVKTNGPELLLPNMNYTQRQLFWISFAQTFCGIMTPDALKEKIQNDVHTPHEFRIIGSVVNRPEFANDFQCAKGAEMNSEDKCFIW